MKYFGLYFSIIPMYYYWDYQKGWIGVVNIEFN